jgi:hypothetical protein
MKSTLILLSCTNIELSIDSTALRPEEDNFDTCRFLFLDTAIAKANNLS